MPFVFSSWQNETTTAIMIIQQQLQQVLQQPAGSVADPVRAIGQHVAGAHAGAGGQRHLRGQHPRHLQLPRRRGPRRRRARGLLGRQRVRARHGGVRLFLLLLFIYF